MLNSYSSSSNSFICILHYQLQLISRKAPAVQLLLQEDLQSRAGICTKGNNTVRV